jgi:hypothetical protein
LYFVQLAWEQVVQPPSRLVLEPLVVLQLEQVELSWDEMVLQLPASAYPKHRVMILYFLYQMEQLRQPRRVVDALPTKRLARVPLRSEMAQGLAQAALCPGMTRGLAQGPWLWDPRGLVRKWGHVRQELRE